MKSTLLKNTGIKNCCKTLLQYCQRYLFYISKLKEWLSLYIFYKDLRPEYKKFSDIYSNGSILKEKIIPRRVIYMNDWDKNGGIADRIKGILTSYSLAKQNDRSFYIYWTQPFSLMRYLEPASVDWRIKSDEILYEKKTSLPLIIVARNPYYFQNKIESLIFKHYFKTKKELHVRTNHFLCEDISSELFKELFKPSDHLQKELDQYKTKCPYYSFSFRFLQLLGDFEDIRGEVLQEDEKKYLIEKCLKELAKLLKSLPEGYKAFVASDSKTFTQKAAQLDPRIFSVEGEIMHPVSYFRGKEQSEVVHLKTFLDFFLIMDAEKVYRMQTGKMYSSGFPHLASIVGKKTFITHYF